MLFSHMASMDKSAYTRRILSGVPQSDWKRPVGGPDTSTMKNDLSFHNLIVEDATKLALCQFVSFQPTTAKLLHFF